MKSIESELGGVSKVYDLIGEMKPKTDSLTTDQFLALEHSPMYYTLNSIMNRILDEEENFNLTPENPNWALDLRVISTPSILQVYHARNHSIISMACAGLGKQVVETIKNVFWGKTQLTLIN